MGRKKKISKAIKKKVYSELNKKNPNWKKRKIKARFVCALSISFRNKKIACELGKLRALFPIPQKVEMVLDMILYLSHRIKKNICRNETFTKI